MANTIAMRATENCTTGAKEELCSAPLLPEVEVGVPVLVLLPVLVP